jgi:hypothetical protein
VLKDTLNELLGGNTDHCKFGTVLGSLDSETSSVLMKLMNDTSISVRSIHAALVSEDIEIGRTTIDAARRCVLGQTKCKCNSVKGLIQ